MYLEIEENLSVKCQNAGLFISRGCGRHPKRIIDSHELIYVVDGSLSIREAEQDFTVQEKEYLILFPNRLHFGTAPHPKNAQYYWIHFDVNPLLGKDKKRISKIPQYGKVNKSESLNFLFRWHLHEQETKSLNQKATDLILALMLEIIIEPDSTEEQTEKQKHSLILAQHAYEIIQKYFHQKLTTSIIAEKLCCNPDYLGLIFRRQYGTTLTESVRQTRLKYAKRLLIESTDHISQVSNNVGFDNVNYFCRVFKAYEKITPKKYRNLFSETHINTR